MNQRVRADHARSVHMNHSPAGQQQTSPNTNTAVLLDVGAAAVWHGGVYGETLDIMLDGMVVVTKQRFADLPAARQNTPTAEKKCNHAAKAWKFTRSICDTKRGFLAQRKAHFLIFARDVCFWPIPMTAAMPARPATETGSSFRCRR